MFVPCVRVIWNLARLAILRNGVWRAEFERSPTFASIAAVERSHAALKFSDGDDSQKDSTVRNELVLDTRFPFG